MNLSLADGAAVAVNFHIPLWIVDGVGFAIVLTLGMALMVTLTAEMSGDYVGFMRNTGGGRVLAYCFLFYGLIPGLADSAAWIYLGWWIGLIVGIVLFAGIWWGHMTLHERRLHGKSTIPRLRRK